MNKALSNVNTIALLPLKIINNSNNNLHTPLLIEANNIEEFRLKLVYGYKVTEFIESQERVY